MTGSKNEEAVEEITRNDVFGDDILRALILPTITKFECGAQHQIKEVTARLANALASVQQGRFYLGKFVDTLSSATFSMSASTTLDMLVATICKLSIESVSFIHVIILVHFPKIVKDR